MKLMENINDFEKANKRCKKCDILAVEPDENEGKIEIYASFVKSPTVLVADRVFVDAKYLWQNEYLTIMSSEGNDHFRREYFNTHDTDGLIEARNLISGFKFTPILDANN